MTEQNTDTSNTPSDDFAQQAEEASVGLIAEFWDFLRYNKKWWLTPIILVLLVIAALAIWGGSAVAPFIYPGL